MARGVASGDIRLVDLGKKAGTRPALVLTRTAVLPWLNAVTLAPITRTVRGLKAEIPLGSEEGLKGPSVAQLDAIQTVPMALVGRWLGSLPAHRRRELADAILYAFALSDLDDH